VWQKGSQYRLSPKRRTTWPSFLANMFVNNLLAIFCSNKKIPMNKKPGMGTHPQEVQGK
jgi:hypothetical protein